MKLSKVIRNKAKENPDRPTRFSQSYMKKLSARAKRLEQQIRKYKERTRPLVQIQIPKSLYDKVIQSLHGFDGLYTAEKGIVINLDLLKSAEIETKGFFSLLSATKAIDQSINQLDIGFVEFRVKD